MWFYSVPHWLHDIRCCLGMNRKHTFVSFLKWSICGQNDLTSYKNDAKHWNYCSNECPLETKVIQQLISTHLKQLFYWLTGQVTVVRNCGFCSERNGLLM